MYETEANSTKVPNSDIPVEIERQFAGLDALVLARTLLPWSEHCTECVWPSCYTTCDLYAPRQDGRCQRFAEGMVRVDCPSALNSYLLRITFKQWAKLWTPATVHLYPTAKARSLEQRDYRVGSLIQILPSSLKSFATRKRYGYKKRTVSRHSAAQQLPTSFLIECYNPETQTVRLSLTLRSPGQTLSVPFQKLLTLTPGFHRFRVPMTEIESVLDVRRPFDIELAPEYSENLITLYFGTMDFVRERELSPVLNKPVKCVIWDLDNTIWNGTLVEDGPEALTLRPGIRDVIRVLDERGILQSIASKNNHAEALAVLKRFEIDQYFLYPQISWDPKSEGVQRIARRLNIGIDSLLFIDDSAFELEEVRTALPEVRVMHANDFQALPDIPDCRTAVTAESRGRRHLYQMEATRQQAAVSFGNDYFAFLRDACITIQIQPLSAGNIARVHELTQRTNQMNFSGKRYSREVLEEILASDSLDTYVLSCEDRFGGYGIVGFCIVDAREPRMTDLMFSCRIQSKRVEHAFLTYLLRRYLVTPGVRFYMNYRRTAKNAPSGKVFADFGMEEIETVDGITSLVFPAGREIPDDHLVTVLESQIAAGVA